MGFAGDPALKDGDAAHACFAQPLQSTPSARAAMRVVPVVTGWQPPAQPGQPLDPKRPLVSSRATLAGVWSTRLRSEFLHSAAGCWGALCANDMVSD